MYIDIDCKQIQNSACSEIGVMLRLLLLKDEQESDLHSRENNEGLYNGTDILNYLTLPWANSERGVCDDSYFASVSSAEKMMQLGLQFIVVVKTENKKY